MIYRNSRALTVPNVDLLTLLFEHEKCGASEDTRLHASAVNPDWFVTKAQARDLTKRVAHGLRHEYGIGSNGPGKDIVTVMCSGQFHLPVLCYGVIAAGGVYSAMSTSATTKELSAQLSQYPPSILICSPETRAVAIKSAQNAGLAETNVVVLESSADMVLRNYATGVNCISEQQLNWRKITNPTELEKSLICIIYSSGTTGPPKGVCLSHLNLVAQAVLPGDLSREKWANDEAMRQQPHFEYRTVAHLPVAHIAGLQGYFVNPFYAGGLVYWMPKFDLPQLLHYCKEYQITMLLSVPAIYLLIAKSPLVKDQFDSLRVAQCGAAPLGPEVQKMASLKLGKGQCYISQTWGLSETAGSLTSLLWGPKDVTGSAGLLVPNVDMRLVDEDNNDVAPGTPGEPLVRGPVVFNGYYKNNTANAESFVDGWFRTGDIAVLRNDLLYIVDRKKELIKYKGHQVAPAELEALLLSHPKISDAAVIGVENESTELPRAYVVADQTQITAQEIMRFVKDSVANHKQLRGGVAFLQEIPKTASGKILRKDLRRLAARESKL